ncbi:MAG TPA: phosphoribosylanthranilate isomerase [Chloroflexia bacterium]|nr:phosphoribosylanthranilate isomerase [Chloroflexia bacterium]
MAYTPKIKICGVRTLQAAQVAAESGADMLGLVFYPPSPRYLAPTAAHTLSKEVRQLPVHPALVGLFVNIAQAELAAASERYQLDYLQLSGDETRDQVREASHLRPVIKALRLPPELTVSEALRVADNFGDLDNVILLIDTHKKGMYGGTGQTGDWEIARAISSRYRCLLAGGLHPGNVSEAIQAVRPWGVDVSSGVEQDGVPGEKDLEKIRQFCRAAKPVKKEK